MAVFSVQEMWKENDRGGGSWSKEEREVGGKRKKDKDMAHGDTHTLAERPHPTNLTVFYVHFFFFLSSPVQQER